MLRGETGETVNERVMSLAAQGGPTGFNGCVQVVSPLQYFQGYDERQVAPK